MTTDRSFLDALAKGSLGVRLRVPESFRLLQGMPNAVLLLDPATTTAFHFSLTPLRLELHPKHDAQLKEDAELSARIEFLEQWNAAPSHGSRTPRTSDGKWSPLIECERIEVDTESALRAVFRSSYDAGRERVHGLCSIPLPRGLFVARVIADAESTGYRESVLMLSEEQRTGKKGEFPPQSVYDNPAHDAAFPTHPLSRVRKGLAWLINASGIEVADTDAFEPEGERELQSLNCAIVPPPRYRMFNAQAVGGSASAAMFCCMGLRPSPISVLTVYIERTELLQGADVGERLKELAENDARGWMRAGAVKSLTQTAKVVSSDGKRTVVENRMQFEALTAKKHAFALWFVDEDGIPFRIDVGGDVAVPIERMEAEVRAVYRSFRRL